MMAKLIPWVLTALVIFLVFWFPSWSGSRLRGLLWLPPSESGNYSELLAENQALKAEIALYREIKQVLGESRTSGALPAVVYSRYPLNFKSQILVNVGEDAGVGVGRAAILPGGVLIGRVEKVFSNSSLIQTLFDPDFQAAVRIGDAGVEALFKGSSEPKLTLIPRGAKVNPGDIVYLADPGFPYGLAVGEVEQIYFSQESLFQEATLKFAYDLNALRAVLILPKP
jgi:cell shape-determining protein MreC